MLLDYLEISPNADFIAIVIGLGEANTLVRFEEYQMTVKQKLKDIEWNSLVGYKADKENKLQSHEANCKHTKNARIIINNATCHS